MRKYLCEKFKNSKNVDVIKLNQLRKSNLKRNLKVEVIKKKVTIV